MARHLERAIRMKKQDVARGGHTVVGTARTDISAAGYAAVMR